MRRLDVSAPHGVAGSMDRERGSRNVAVMAALALFFSVLTASAAEPAAASSHIEEKPLVVALCHGSNQSWPQNFDKTHFEDMFSETSGSSTIADYWRDISHGRFSIDGTLVLDVQLDVASDAIGDRDQNDFGKCKEGVNDKLGGTDWQKIYAGPVVFKPQTVGRTLKALSDDPSDNELKVQAEAPSVMDDWPDPPFTLVLTKTGTLWQNPKDKDTNKEIDTNFENTTVTAVDKDYTTNIVTFTLDRKPQEGYRHRDTDGGDDPFPSVKAWPADTEVKTISDIYGSKNRTAVVSAHTSPSVINQELGHFFGYGHSRRLSTATSGYGNCFDVMSTLTCTGHYFQVPFSYPEEANNYPAGTLNQYNGPGMVSPFLDLKNWIAAGDRTVFDPTACTQQTYSMRALGLTGSDLHQVRVPTAMGIRDGVKSEYLAVELRSQQFHWDQGIPRDAFVLNLKGDDDLAYLVDDSGAGGTSGMNDGDYYVFDPGTPNDSSDDRFFFANAIAEQDGTGKITLATCPFTSNLGYTGPTSFTYGTFPEVTAGFALTNGAPGPEGTVDFTLGGEDCSDTIPFSDQEDGTGEAACNLEIDVAPGTHDLTARWDGVEGVFEAAEEVVGVSVAKRGSSLDVDEPTATYHASVTLSATLTQASHPDDSILTGIPDATVTLSIGSGGDAQSCSATTDSFGRVSCQIDSVEQTPGSVPVNVTFAGDDFYKSTSDSSTITVQKRATTLTVDQPVDTIYHDPVTLEATLTEAPHSGDSDPSPIAGATVTLSIGSGGDAQSCSATTDSSGYVSCDIDSVEQKPGPSVPVNATFAGDAFYLPDSDSDTFTVLKRATELTLTGPDFAALDGSITLTGTLIEADTTASVGAPIEGRDVTLSLGDGADAQSCTATTNTSGVASCAISDVDQQLGPQAISAAFDGDDFYLSSSDSDELIVFEWTAGGHFVVGDGSAVLDATVTFWSSEWYLENTVSGGQAPDAFKGFANTPSGPTDCGTTTWTSFGGNKADVAEEVPVYTAMLVTDSVAKSGNDIGGSTVAIAIVRVDPPGTQPAPGHPSTATVLGFLCGP